MTRRRFFSNKTISTDPVSPDKYVFHEYEFEALLSPVDTVTENDVVKAMVITSYVQDNDSNSPGSPDMIDYGIITGVISGVGFKQGHLAYPVYTIKGINYMGMLPIMAMRGTNTIIGNDNEDDIFIVNYKQNNTQDTTSLTGKTFLPGRDSSVSDGVVTNVDTFLYNSIKRKDMSELRIKEDVISAMGWYSFKAGDIIPFVVSSTSSDAGINYPDLAGIPIVFPVGFVIAGYSSPSTPAIDVSFDLYFDDVLLPGSSSGSDVYFMSESLGSPVGGVLGCCMTVIEFLMIATYNSLQDMDDLELRLNVGQEKRTHVFRLPYLKDGGPMDVSLIMRLYTKFIQSYMPVYIVDMKLGKIIDTEVISHLTPYSINGDNIEGSSPHPVDDTYKPSNVSLINISTHMTNPMAPSFDSMTSTVAIVSGDIMGVKPMYSPGTFIMDTDSGYYMLPSMMMAYKGEHPMGYNTTRDAFVVNALDDGYFSTLIGFKAGIREDKGLVRFEFPVSGQDGYDLPYHAIRRKDMAIFYVNESFSTINGEVNLANGANYYFPIAFQVPTLSTSGIPGNYPFCVPLCMVIQVNTDPSKEIKVEVTAPGVSITTKPHAVACPMVGNGETEVANIFITFALMTDLLTMMANDRGNTRQVNITSTLGSVSRVRAIDIPGLGFLPGAGLADMPLDECMGVMYDNILPNIPMYVYDHKAEKVVDIIKK